jgi:hypothetical protein
LLCWNDVLITDSFFLHPELRDHPTGLKCVEPLLEVIPQLRKQGVKILWVYVMSLLYKTVIHIGNRNWGLTDAELHTIPPSLARGFMKGGYGGFGSEIPGNFGRLLMRDARNSELYGPLQEEYLKGQKAGTDVWIHKNRSRIFQHIPCCAKVLTESAG